MGKSSSTTIGYRYYLGFHIGLCHGPIDAITEILVDERSVYTGRWTGGLIAINAPYVFGGDDREGGVVGAMELLMGAADQLPTGAIAAVYPNMPGFRGIATLYADSFYMGNNPYLKPLAYRAARIHVRQDGIAQWYDAKAEIAIATPATETAIKSFDRFDGAEWVYHDSGTGIPFGDAYGLSPEGYLIAKGTNVGGNSDVLKYTATGLVGAGAAHRVSVEVMSVSLFGSQPRADVAPKVQLLIDAGGTTVHGVPIATTAEAEWHPFAELSGNFYDLGLPQIVANVWYRYDFYTNTSPSNEVLIYVTRLDTNVQTHAQVLAVNKFSATGFEFLTRRNSAGPRPDIVFRNVTFWGVSSLAPSGDMNPAHILRECLTDPEWGDGYPDEAIDDASFTAAADTLYAEEFGIALNWNKQTTLEKFEQEVLRHCKGELYVSRSTGKFVMKLIRDDYDPDALPVLDPAHVVAVENLNAPTPGELTSSVTVQYYDRARRGKGSVAVQDPALSTIQGAVINQKFDYQGITRFDLASRVAARELRVVSTPLISCQVTADRTASALGKGDVFKLVWPDYGIEGLILRVSQVDLGDGLKNQIKLLCVQDVFSQPDINFAALPEDTWTAPYSGAPVAAGVRLVTEAPYLALVTRSGQADANSRLALEPDLGHLAVAAARPADDAERADVIVDVGAGYGDPFTLRGFGAYAVLDADIGHLDATATSSDYRDMFFSVTSPVSLPLPVLGSIEAEIVQVTAVADPDSAGAIAVTLARGLLDTVPAPHPAGALLIVWGDRVDSDEVEYLAAESLDVKILPIMGGQRLLPTAAPIDTVVMASRAIRPYPPGNVKLEGLRYPVGEVFIGPLSLTWSHRDRLLQTAAPIDQYATDIGPEAGTTYTVRIYDGSDALADEITGISGTSETLHTPTSEYSDDARIELLSARDGYESWQAHSIPIYWADSATPSSSSYVGFSDRVLLDNPAAWWKMNDSSGSTMVDAIGGYNGVYGGSPTLGVAGFIPGGTTAVKFDGTTQAATVPANAALFPGTGQFCVEMIMSINNTNVSYPFFYGNVNVSPFKAVWITVNSDGAAQAPGRMTLRDSINAGHIVVANATVLNDGHWRHYIFQRRNDAGTWKLEIYINGTLDNSVTIASPEDIVNSSFAGLLYGRTAGNQQVGGICDEVLYYPAAALSAQAIADHYHGIGALPPGFASGAYQSAVLASTPTAWWPLDETYAPWIHDRVAGRNGASGNSPTLGASPQIASGTAITFNGTSQYIQVEHFAALNPGSGEYAIEMWAKFTGTTLGVAFGKFLTTGNFDGPTVFFNFNGSAEAAGVICMRDRSGAGYFVATASTGLNNGVWRHYVFQRRLVSTGPDVWKLEIYINGALDNSATLSTLTSLSNTNVLYLCSRNGMQWIAGTFDELAYYVGKSLTSTEITNHYTA